MRQKEKQSPFLLFTKQCNAKTFLFQDGPVICTKNYREGAHVCSFDLELEEERF